jgi:hypothetical protein
MIRAAFVCGAVCLGIAFFEIPVAAPLGNEVVHFGSGRTMAIAGHQLEGGTIVLKLHGGGEIRCDVSLIERIEVGEPPQVQSKAAAVSPSERSGLRLLERPFGGLILAAAERHGVDQYLIHALIEAESGYRPWAESARGAMGLMQLMPELASDYDLNDPYDPAKNIDTGTRHLRNLIDKYGISGALAAYNAGEGSVIKFNGIPPFQETRQYVERVMELVGVNQGD